MKRFLPMLSMFFALAMGLAMAAPPREKMVFAVVVARHGVRSISKMPPQYAWADWAPVGKSELTAHGYRLATYMGQFYRGYFSHAGLPLQCRRQDAFVYADRDQRTLATGRALIEGLCGSASGLALYHAADATPSFEDPLFNATAWAASAGRIDAKASLSAVRAAASNMDAPEFAGLQRLLDARCAGTCAAVTAEPTAIGSKEGLAALDGPVGTASTYAEDLFLEYAQCRADLEFAGSDVANAETDLQSAMRLHVLQYDVNARNAYNPLVRGGTLFAHIVGMLEAKAGTTDADVSNPDMSRYSLAVFSGHDTELGALGGILDANWDLGNGLVPDDMPPGSALVFELYRTPQNRYRVRMRFAYQTLAQFRNYAYLPNGVQTVPVRMKDCSGKDCSVPLDRLWQIAHAIAQRGLVRKAWTPDSYAPVQLAPLKNPVWTRCAG